MSESSSSLPDIARASSSWPFHEARAVLDERLKGKTPEKGYVLFETGYGPSGLPHIGTFGEVVRTTWVRRAFEVLAPGMPTRLFAFSDDMDGLRKVPDNVPNAELIRPHLGKPLTRVPDPFGTHDSFGRHNNDRLRGFLDGFGFDYDFKSATDMYGSGTFDSVLLKVLERYEEIVAVILPTLGEERRQTYSPFMPICPRTQKVLQAKVLERRLETGSIVYQDPETGEAVEVAVTGGACKLQWKVDWGMRWAALDVDYEMSGKDLLPTFDLSARICRLLGGTPPLKLTYELFLDECGQKISKSKGNGLSVEQWLTYGPPESLSLFMFQKPKAAKRLHFDVIPRAMDDYCAHLEAFAGQEGAARLDNPVWHIHKGAPPAPGAKLSFSMLLNLAGVAHSDDPAALWSYIGRYIPSATRESEPLLERLIVHAVAYYRDFVKPALAYREATTAEKTALAELRDALAAQPETATAEDLQALVYAVGKAHPETFPSLRDWFKALYEILLGQDQGPRMGGFFALYGLAESIALLERAISLSGSTDPSVDGAVP